MKEQLYLQFGNIPVLEKEDKRQYRSYDYKVSRIAIVSDVTVPQAVRQASDVYDYLRSYFDTLDREHFVVLHLNGKNRVIGRETVSIGSISATAVHPREVFKSAIINSSVGIIVAHNHPSGDPTPSREDVEITKRLVQAGEIIGIKVLDHIVCGQDGLISLKEFGVIALV